MVKKTKTPGVLPGALDTFARPASHCSKEYSPVTPSAQVLRRGLQRAITALLSLAALARDKVSAQPAPRFVGRHTVMDARPGARLDNLEALARLARLAPLASICKQERPPLRWWDQRTGRVDVTWVITWRGHPGDVLLTTNQFLYFSQVCRRSTSQIGWSPDPRALTLTEWRWLLNASLGPLRDEPQMLPDELQPAVSILSVGGER
jgi:hypothetical protein